MSSKIVVRIIAHRVSGTLVYLAFSTISTKNSGTKQKTFKILIWLTLILMYGLIIELMEGWKGLNKIQIVS